ncbi:MAG: hypothetical protein ACAH95_10325 [Fimbriimonas sp.]
MLLLLSALIVGCAGDAVILPDSTSGGNAFAGIYNTSYSRGVAPAGTMVLGVHSNGSIDVAVSDNAEGFFSGTGVIDTNNSFFVNCQNVNAGTSILVNGTLAGSGAGRTASGNVTGEFTFTYTASFAHDLSTGIFANHYEGFFGGGAQGTFMIDVNANGSITGMVHAGNNGDLPITGTVTNTGLVQMHAQLLGGQYSMDFVGAFSIHPDSVMGSGSWTDSAEHEGTWDAGNSNEG